MMKILFSNLLNCELRWPNYDDLIAVWCRVTI